MFLILRLLFLVNIIYLSFNDLKVVMLFQKMVNGNLNVFILEQMQPTNRYKILTQFHWKDSDPKDMIAFFLNNGEKAENHFSI